MGLRRTACLMAMLALGAVFASTAASADDPSTLTFAEPTSVTVARSEGDVTLTVLRDGDMSQAASVTVSSSEGFQARVTIGVGATTGTITVPLPERGDLAPGGFVTITLTDPSPGSLIGQPDTVSISIYEDEPDPSTVNRAPSTTIDRTGAAVISGRASDPENRLARVQLSVLRREGQTCRSVRPNGRLAASRRSCAPAYRLAAAGTERWAFRPTRKLPAGRYVVAARAIDAAGAVDPSPATRAFTVR